MKILIVLVRLRGGVGRSNTEITRVLSKKGHKVDILSREDNLKIYSFIQSIFPLRKKIKEMMKKENYDIIYTQDYTMALPLLIPYPIYWKKHINFACGEKTWGIHKFIQGIISRIMGKKIGVVCHELKNKFPKATLIYRGTNFNLFKPLANKKKKFIGWAERDLENFSEEELKKVSKAVEIDYKIAKNIPPEKMNNYYNQCLVFISLPYRGGYNNVWAEALASGVPLVIGNNKGPGKKFPIKRVSSEEKRKRGIRQKKEIKRINHVEEIINIIKNSKMKTQREWLINNGFSWEEKAKEVEKFLGGQIKSKK